MLIHWAFQRFYREFAWTYDAVAWLVSHGLWRDWTLVALPYLRGRVLELGCGTGHVQAALAATRPGAAIGLDASPFMLALTQRRLRRAELVGTLVRAVAQALPCIPASFDTVLATFPTEYVLHPATLAEVRRILAPGGQFVIVDAATFTHTGLYAHIVRIAYQLALLAPPGDESDATRPHAYAHGLAAAGFSVTVHPAPVKNSQVQVFVALPPQQRASSYPGQPMQLAGN